MKLLDFNYLKIVFIVGVILLLTSCLDLRFETAQPKDSVELTEFPSHLIGTYTFKPDEIKRKSSRRKDNKTNSDTTSSNLKTDTLIITKHTIKVSMISHLVQKEYDIRDSNIMVKEFNDTCFIFSELLRDSINNISSWNIYPFSYSENGIALYSSELIEKKDFESMVSKVDSIGVIRTIYKDIKKANKKKRRKKKHEKEIDYYLLNPTNEELSRLLSSEIFPKFVEFKKIDK